MNFEIVGKLLERTVSLASKLNCDAEILFAEIYRKGLEAMEMAKPVRAKQLPSEETASFIELNWLSMSDDEIAKALGFSHHTVTQYRCNMGLVKRSHSMNVSTHPIEPVAELSEEEKAKIASKPEDSHQILSASLHKPIGMIKSYRLKLAEENIREHGTDESDVIAARKFGLRARDYLGLRRKLHVLRIRGGAKNHPNKKMEPCELGTVEEIRYALTEGGQTVTGIIEAKGLKITRQRAHQIIDDYGLGGITKQRKPLWYAHRLVGLEKTELARNLTDKDWVTKRLAESGGRCALAAKLSVPEWSLGSYLRLRLGLETDLEKSHGEMVELKCSFCKSSFWRPKKLVERDKKLHPNKTNYFHNKICQGKWLGALPKKKGKRKKQS